jgi:hypothetical protein
MMPLENCPNLLLGCNNWRRDAVVGLLSSTAYTFLIVGLVYFNVLELPDFLTSGTFTAAQ